LVFYADIWNLRQLAEALIVRNRYPTDGAIPWLRELGCHVSDGESAVIAEIDADGLVSGLDVAEDLIKERVFGGGVEAHGDGSVHEAVEIGGDGCGRDEICGLELEMVALSVYEQAQHDQFEEVVETTRVSRGETDRFGLLELSTDNLWRPFDDRILHLSLLISFFVQLRHHFLFHRFGLVH